MQPTILHIINAKPNLTASSICGVVFESQSCPFNIGDEFKWTINIDSSPPKLINDYENDNIINIIQITDIHYDRNYEPFGNAYCKEPTCCRKGQNDTNTSNKVAGYWGDYNYCDSPWHAVVDVLEQIKATHQVCRIKIYIIVYNPCYLIIIIVIYNFFFIVNKYI